jgi:hypothetical protein
LRAFFERVRARRGPQVAATATARKLVVLFWHLLTREQDYAFARPAMTRNKIRRLELLTAHRRRRAARASPAANQKPSSTPSASSPAKPRPPTGASSATGAQPASENGCGRDEGARIYWALEGQSRAADSISPTGLRFARSVTRTHRNDRKGPRRSPLDFHPSLSTRSSCQPAAFSSRATRRASLEV